MWGFIYKDSHKYFGKATNNDNAKRKAETIFF